MFIMKIDFGGDTNFKETG